MLSLIRKQMSATNLMVVAALIFAMAGGAFAAGGGGKHHDHSAGHHGHAAKKGKKGKAKGKRGPRGKQGPEGKEGPPGPAGEKGATGLQGLKGDTGATGLQGIEGKEGPAGKSVTATAIPTEQEACEGRGGAEVIQEGEPEGIEVCNGEEGSPWSAGGVLPKGQTETGTWGFSSGEEITYVPISFQIPLAKAPEATYVPAAEATCNEEAEPEKGECLSELTAKCPGVESGKPTAGSGMLCLYIDTAVKPGTIALYFLLPFVGGSPYGVGPSGTVGFVNCSSAKCSRYGTWAVTAE